MSNNPLVPTGGTALVITDELRRAADYARDAKSPATRRAYQSDWHHFEAWCAARGTDPLPASIETCAAYLASLADLGLKVSTITRRVAAIGYAHRVTTGCPSPVSSEPIKALMQGIRRRIGVAVERKTPATARAIGKMVATAGPRDRAVLLLGFAAALRRSELAALQLADIEFTPEGVIVHIRRSKTDQEGAGHQVAVPRGSKLRPVEALESWLKLRQNDPGPLFHISSGTVANIVKRYAKRAKLDPKLFSGHSLRAGFVTSALEAGADIMRVMDVTRHTQVQTLKAYDRRAKAFKHHAGAKFL